MKSDFQATVSPAYSSPKTRSRYAALLGLLLLVPFIPSSDNTVSSSQHLQNLERCQSIAATPGPPPSFQPVSRLAKHSDRYVPGTPPTLIKNATIWTGNVGEVVKGDVLLDKGLIQAIGHVPSSLLRDLKKVHGDVHTVDAHGKWVTPGIVDLHSHIGVDSAPVLNGAMDTNSRKAPILPWLRSVDALNTRDDSYALALAGGVTTVQVLPGSANNIGGQAFLIKLRPTAEKSTSSLLLEPPSSLIPNQTSDHEHWRHMKHACGENPSRVYSQTRMDSSWNFRNAYNTARKLKLQQDAFCANVQAVEAHRTSWRRWFSNSANTEALGDFPEDLQWESLVDVLRGKVKLSVHCYEAVDLDMLIRLSNEFQFPIASIHHALETYLVPDLLKKTWGGAPSIALFATNARKKREMYRASEFAPKILSDAGFNVVMKSDHPVLNSRYLLFEAQQAHYYGLDADTALSSITTHSAAAAGVGHRVGKAVPGFDADVVIWDSHPLAIGATPVQVWVDGIAQLKNPHPLSKPKKLQRAPVTPNWTKEIQDAVKYDGLPPFHGQQSKIIDHAKLKFTGVKSVRVAAQDGHISTLYDDEGKPGPGTSVVVHDGSISFCAPHDTAGPCNDRYAARIVHLKGGSIAPGLTTFGSRIGLAEIAMEESTNDGKVLDSLTGSTIPALLGEEPIIRAVDGLQFGGRNALLAYKGGVTQSIVAPYSTGFMCGLSTTFETGAANSLERGAVVQTETALHVTIIYWATPSVSTQIAALRHLLTHSTHKAWVKVREGKIPLVVNVASADIMATLITLKSEYEHSTGRTLRFTFAGAEEAHLLAKEIAAANISVVLTSPRPFPRVWEQRRIMPGPPLSQESGLSVLLSHGVNVGVGVVDDFYARNLRFDLSWAMLESRGKLTEEDALALGTTNLHIALGSKVGTDLVVYKNGTIFDFESKVAGVISLERGIYEEF